MILEKGLLLILSLLFLFSCSSNCPRWEIQKVSGCQPYFNSARMWLASQNEYSNLELEIDRNSSGLRMYLNIYSLPFTSSSDNPLSVEVLVSIDDDVQIVFGECLRGGQRLLLQPDITSDIITALEIGQRVIISVGRYSSEIISTNFNQCFRELYSGCQGTLGT